MKKFGSKPPGEDVFQIVCIDGEVLCEYHIAKDKEESKEVWAQLVDVDADGKKELVLSEADLVYQLNPHDFSDSFYLARFFKKKN